MKKQGKCIVIGAGDLTVGEIECKKEDYIIAVDGGLGYCSLLNLEPDMIIGDFDSVSEKEYEAICQLKKEIPDRIIQLNKEKDDTDMLAALRLGLEQGYDDFRIYAGTGGRFDHTLANVQCLLYLKKQGAVGYLMDGAGMMIVLKDEEVHLNENLEGYLSLLCIGTEAKGITIEGMKYPLKDYHMKNDFPIGISNEFVGQPATIKVEEGEVVCILQLAVEEE